MDRPLQLAAGHRCQEIGDNGKRGMGAQAAGHRGADEGTPDKCVSGQLLGPDDVVIETLAEDHLQRDDGQGECQGGHGDGQADAADQYVQPGSNPCDRFPDAPLRSWDEEALFGRDNLLQ